MARVIETSRAWSSGSRREASGSSFASRGTTSSRTKRRTWSTIRACSAVISKSIAPSLSRGEPAEPAPRVGGVALRQRPEVGHMHHQELVVAAHVAGCDFGAELAGAAAGRQSRLQLASQAKQRAPTGIADADHSPLAISQLIDAEFA